MADAWRTIRSRFRPEDVASPAWLVPRPESPIDELVRGIEWSRDRDKVLLCGSRGTGKTTELRRAQRAFGSGPRRVLYFDLYRTLENERSQGRLDDLAPWEIAVLIGGAALGALRSLGSPDEPALTARLVAATADLLPGDEAARGEQTRALVSGFTQLIAAGTSAVLLGSGVAAPAAAAGGAATTGLLGSLFAKLQLGAAARPRPDDDAVIGELGRTVSDVLQGLATLGGPPLLLLDGLDRATEGEPGKLSVDRWFTSSLLAGLASPIIATAPWWGREGKTPGWRPVSLCEVAVVDRERAPMPDPRGIDFFLELFRLRTADLDRTLVPTFILEELAYLSGGIARDFLKLVGGNLAGFCGPRGIRADDTALRAVTADWRINEVEAGLTADDIALLNTVRDPRSHHRPPSGDAATRLIVTRRLLPYGNGSEWFYPHPALFRGNLLDEPGSTS